MLKGSGSPVSVMRSGVGQISVLRFTYQAVTLVVSKGVGYYELGRMWKAVDGLGDLAAGSCEWA